MWKFDQSENVAAITTRQVLEERFPILTVIHYSDDHSWGFLCGTTDSTDDGRVILMKEALEIDPSVEQMCDLKPGYRAHRSSKLSTWVVDDEPHY
jgi:hypothetical protein